MSYRVIALALAVVLLVTFATPAKAEAIEPMTILAIAGAAVIVLVLIVYLVVANVEGPKMSQSPSFEPPLLALTSYPVAQEPAPEPLVLVSVSPPSQGQ